MQSRSWQLVVSIAVTAFLALPASALAAPPGNDNFANAADLTVPDIAQLATNAEATTEANEPGTTASTTCRGDDTVGTGGNGLAKSVWYSFVGTGEPVTISSNLSGFDTVLFIYRDTNGTLAGLAPETCNDDIDFDAGRFQSEAVVIPTDQGQLYYVQVGGCCGGAQNDQGELFLSIFPPPANDLRGDARTLPLGTTVDTFTLGALEQQGERLTCGSTPYAKTVWYQFTVPALGDVKVTTGGFGTVSALYRGTSFLKCAVGANNASAVLNQRVQAGTYFLQVGGIGAGARAEDGTVHTHVDYVRDTDLDDDGYSPPADCNDGNAAIHPGAPSVVGNGVLENCVDDPADLDKDDDGINDDVDCNDDNPSIHQGAPEILGNSVDENCDNKAEDYPRIRTAWAYKTRRGHVVRFKSLTLKNIPAGATVRVICKGKKRKGCVGKAKYTRKFTKSRGKLSLTKRVRRYRLRKGAVLEIRITAPDMIGRVFRVNAKADGNSSDADFCLRPGETRAKRCS